MEVEECCPCPPCVVDLGESLESQNCTVGALDARVTATASSPAARLVDPRCNAGDSRSRQNRVTWRISVSVESALICTSSVATTAEELCSFETEPPRGVPDGGFDFVVEAKAREGRCGVSCQTCEDDTDATRG